MRFAPALLCFFVLFSAAAAVPTAQSSPTHTYISTRDRYVAAFKAHAPDGPTEDKALADLERLLKQDIPSWQASGFPAQGRINLETLDPHGLGFGLLDGLSYKSGGATVLVTTVPLVKRWLADHHHLPSGRETMPITLATALRSPTFYSWAIAEDATAEYYGDIPVVSREPVAFAQLVTFAQDVVLDAGPSEIIVAAVRGNTVFIAEMDISATIKPIPVCKRALDLIVARAEALPGTGQSGANSPYVVLLGKADNDYRRCFIANIGKAPEWNDIVRKTQALVDLLH